VVEVSGGAGGVVYVTAGYSGDRRTYWRAPGAAHGTPLAGVPRDAARITAQP
jgi:hypothetical protein